jgi:hypothetical protein
VSSASKEVSSTKETVKAAWAEFVRKVEGGKISDFTGQYVSKATKGVSADGKRVERTKNDAEKWNIRLKKTTVDNSNNKVVPIDPICYDPYDTSCGGPIGGGGGPAPVYSTFMSSENVAPYSGSDNLAGDIYDLKIVKGGSSNLTPLPGYTIIPVDLNKGAGGQYIYMTFTRNPSTVASSGRDDGRVTSGPVRGIIATANTVGAMFVSWPYNATPIWAPGSVWGTWEQPDLNDGAGGRFIASYQTKNEVDGGPIEVGVIAGNSSSIQPPSGWLKLNNYYSSSAGGCDLNERAGGDYIYFCIKRR